MDHITVAKLFKNGNSQAVRLPMEFRFDGEEVLIYREAGRVVLQPLNSDWEAFFTDERHISDDFMVNRQDTQPQKRDLF